MTKEVGPRLRVQCEFDSVKFYASFSVWHFQSVITGNHFVRIQNGNYYNLSLTFVVWLVTGTVPVLTAVFWLSSYLEAIRVDFEDSMGD
jgi:hypothetical protein